MSSSEQIPTGVDTSSIDAMIQVGEQTPQMQEQDIRKMHQMKTSFAHDLSLDLSLLSNQCPMQMAKDQTMNLE